MKRKVYCSHIIDSYNDDYIHIGFWEERFECTSVAEFVRLFSNNEKMLHRARYYLKKNGLYVFHCPFNEEKKYSEKYICAFELKNLNKGVRGL